MKAGSYKIKWRYIHVDESVPAKEAGRLCTVCILQKDGDNVEHINDAVLHPNDRFCRDTGRKVSLAKVLQSSKIPYNDRVLIWEEYRKMKPSGRW